jgi:hypothetical protein
MDMWSPLHLCTLEHHYFVDFDLDWDLDYPLLFLQVLWGWVNSYLDYPLLFLQVWHQVVKLVVELVVL